MKCVKCNTKRDMFKTTAYYGNELKSILVCSYCGCSIKLE